MISRERVDAAFLHQGVDRVPIYQAGFSSAVASQVLGREAWVGGGIQQYREALSLWRGPSAHAEYLERSFADAAELCVRLELDLVRTAYWRKPERPTEQVDAYTFRYGAADGAWEVWRLDPVTEIYACVGASPRPEPGPDTLVAEVEAAETEAAAYAPTAADFPEQARAVARFGATHGIPGTGVGLCIPREPRWLEAVALRPDLVARHLEAQLFCALKCIPVMTGMGLPYLFGGGDMASARGTLYSPAAFHELMLPRLRKISETCLRHGAVHLFASDGNLWPVADDLFGRSGVGGYYEVDRDYMPVLKVRARYPRLTMLGGIRSQVLHRGSVEDVVAETRSALDDARALGGCIVGCSNQIVAGTPARNFHAMMETLHRER